MVNEVEEFNVLNPIMVKDEVIAFLEGVSQNTSYVTYDLEKDDNSGQIFKVLISDDEGVPKGAINLTITSLEGRSLISLSPYAPRRVTEQSLSIGTVDYLLKRAAKLSGLEARQNFDVTMYTTYTSDGFSKVEESIAEVLTAVSESILNAQVEFKRPKNNKSFGQAGSVNLWG